MERRPVVHPFPPLYTPSSKILILGSFPSPKSREAMFFYGHPRNRFWQVISALLEEPFPETVPERRDLLLRRDIAAWDVIASCEIAGASDSSIQNVRPNDLRPILEAAPIRRIYVNGKTAAAMYDKYTRPLTGREAVCLPSTSPANASWTLPKLMTAWSRILEDLKDE